MKGACRGNFARISSSPTTYEPTRALNVARTPTTFLASTSELPTTHKLVVANSSRSIRRKSWNST